MVRFDSVDDLFQSCGAHLDATVKRGTEIENYFVQLILVRICAEFEIKLAALVERRCMRSNDEPTRVFMKTLARDVCRNFSISDIAGILGQFGEAYKKKFSDEVTNKPPTVAWNNIYVNRHVVAHRNGIVQMTFVELEATYRDSLVVFDALIRALELKPRELKGLL